MKDPFPTSVFEDSSTDLFQSGLLHVLVHADRLSGWPVIHRWRHDPSTREVVPATVQNFVDLGVPMRLRSQYDMSDRNFIPEFFNQRSREGRSVELFHLILPTKKRHSEVTVREMKELVEKISPSCPILPPLALSFEEFLQGVLEFYNTPRTNGMLPDEMVIGHQTRSIVPSH